VKRRPGRIRTTFGAGTPVVAVGLPRRPLADVYHQLLTWSWTRLFVTMGAAYVAVIALFALVYLALGPGAVEHARPGSFEDAFFFSFQTMATIGYGTLVPRSTAAHVVSVVQVMMGIAGTAVSTGLVFTKFARPTARVLFSREAVVTRFDGAPALLFRLANARANQIVEARLSVVLVRREVTVDGHEVRRIHDLPLRRDRSLVFSLTWLAVHAIGPGSPLHGETPESLAASDAVMVVSVTGTDEHLGQAVHARTTYGPAQIRFGVHFVDILDRLPDGSGLVDYTRFHEVEPDAEAQHPAPGATAAPPGGPAPPGAPEAVPGATGGTTRIP
jgi:inward rectifier potassium channel